VGGVLVAAVAVIVLAATPRGILSAVTIVLGVGGCAGVVTGLLVEMYDSVSERRRLAGAVTLAHIVGIPAFVALDSYGVPFAWNIAFFPCAYVVYRYMSKQKSLKS